MRRLERWLLDIAVRMRRGRADAELDEELRFHLEMEAEKLRASGVPESEAHRRARVAFGGVERFREASLATRHGHRVDDALRDVRHGWRGLLRAPVYTVTTVLTLALGIGAATAMFSVLYGVLLRPLAYGDAERLYLLFEASEAGGRRTPSYPTFRDIEGRLTSFEALTYIRGDDFRVAGENGTQQVLAGYVSPGFFPTAAARPLLGRVFDGSAGDVDAVVLSHELWQRRFGGDPSILGRRIGSAEASYTVIGVMPPGFRIPRYASVWLPLESLPAEGRFVLTRRDLHVDSEVWGRVRAGVTEERARGELAQAFAAVAPAYPGGGWTDAAMRSVRSETVGAIGAQLRILAFAVALVLLIACVNVAGLQLARGTTRGREMAVRAALGADRGRLVRQLLTESALLALIGGALGVLLARFAIRLVAALPPTVLPRVDELGMDLRTLGFAAAASLLSAVLFGIVPALRASAAGLTPALRDGAAASGSTRATARMRAGLVVAQIALAVVLTVGSGLLLRSLWMLRQLDVGFSPERVATVRIFPPPRYADPAAARQLYDELQEAIRRVPGVVDVALTNHLPFAGGWMTTPVETGGPAPEQSGEVIVRTVSAEYFDVMGTRLQSGRLFTADDYGTPGSGIVINDVLAGRFFPDADPVGRSVTIFHRAQGRAEYGERIQAVIVGVAGSERFFRLQDDPPAAVFVPYTWMLWPNITLAARTDGPPERLLPALRRAVQQVDADLPVAGPTPQMEWRPLESFVDRSLQQRRLMTTLLVGFAASALLLAVLGIFGLTAYHVTQRTREIGVRVAIGAPRGSVAALVLSRAVGLALLGIAVGIPAAWAGTRLLQSELFGVAASDPATIAAAAAVFIAAALFAAALPTARALRVSPIQALRSE